MPSSEQDTAASDENQAREEYLQERKLLIDWEHASITSFDKALLALSAGALGLSLTYFKDFGAPGFALCVLKVSWALFALAMLGTTWSFLCSHYALRRHRDLLGEVYTSGQESHATNTWSSLTAGLNIFSLICFSLGVCALTVAAMVAFRPK